jgi:hypothetical protein
VLGLGTGQAADLAVPLDRDELIAYGCPTTAPPGWDGGVGPKAGPGHGTRRPWVHNWQFGRRS